MSFSQARIHADASRSWLRSAESADWNTHDEDYALRMAHVHATLAVAEAALPSTPEEGTAQ